MAGAYERDDLRLGMPEDVPGKVVVRPSGTGVRFDHHRFEDDSTEVEVDT